MKIQKIKKSKHIANMKGKIIKSVLVVLGTGILAIHSTSTSNIKETSDRHLIENANGEWQNYSEIVLVTIEHYEGDLMSTYNLYMGLEDDKQIERIYRSFTNPEISMIENINPEKYTTTYHLNINSMLPKQNEEFIANNKIGEIVWGIGINNIIPFSQMSSMELESNEINQEKNR